MRTACLIAVLGCVLVGCEGERAGQIAQDLERIAGRPAFVRAAVPPAAGKVTTQLSQDKRAMEIDLGGEVKMQLILIPAGEFQMGSPAGEKERQECETPVHRVRITRPFYAGVTEVTNAQYRRFRPDHSGRHLDGDDQPALWVSWYDADAFCRWLSEKIGKTVRLPTEAEWEYAARAGTNTRFHVGDRISGVMNSADLPKAGWYGANAKGRSQSVGLLTPNEFSLYDMHGNAWEWCADWFAADYYKRSPEADPAGPSAGQAKVLRGGCYFYWTTYYCRSAHRYRYRPDAREPVTGFRVVVEDGPARKRPGPKFRQPWPPPRIVALPDSTVTPREREVAWQFGRPAVLVPKPAAPPRIDGRLNDDCWSKARPLRFVHLSGQAAPPTQATAARVLADAKTLYFAFDCAESDMKRISAAGGKRDDPIWQGDTVEIFLDTHHRQVLDGYYHIAVSPAGVTMDSSGGKDADTRWDPKLTVATGKSAAGWTVELALPIAELGLPPGEIPTVWGMNLTRYRPEIAAGRPKLGALVPHSWPVDSPEKLRFAEDTGWAQTLCDSSHVPWRFGHALLEVGTQETPAPRRHFEVIARED
ncbi:MAG TPA: SUMF1/EgtB/PvdO family nonheme iron enzyme, partial [Phycisphaerae bacterium]|nr:SUMF1/EgtB/PvdO family nonheme iron enzyme [Phycisphaerae bacterium]